MSIRDENGSTRSCLLPPFKSVHWDKNSLALITMDERRLVVETVDEKSLFLQQIDVGAKTLIKLKFLE